MGTSARGVLTAAVFAAMGSVQAFGFDGPLRNAGGVVEDRMLDWRETVGVEHRDRVARLTRFAERRLGRAPDISDSVVRAGDLPAGIGVDIPVTRLVFSDRTFFDTGSDELTPAGQAVIEAVGEALRGEASDTAVFVAGHTDSRSDDAYNYGLSLRRADRVARALFALGVRQARIWRVGFGEALPLRPNTSDANMARNRRVEFLFARKAEAPSVWLSREPARLCRGAVEAECRRAQAILPKVEATPVTLREARLEAAIGLPKIDEAAFRPLPRRSVAPPEDRRRAEPQDVPRREAGSDDATAREAQAPPAETRLAEAPEDKRVVVIERASPVLIDLREQKVMVGRPER